jgi:hypothetical protein
LEKRQRHPLSGAIKCGEKKKKLKSRCENNTDADEPPTRPWLNTTHEFFLFFFSPFLIHFATGNTNSESLRKGKKDN